MPAQEQHDFANQLCKLCKWIKRKNDKDIHNFLHELEKLGFIDKIESSSSNQDKSLKKNGMCPSL